MRILGIDFGKRRVGLAISDKSRTIAMPLETILVSGIDDLMKKLSEIVDKHGISEIVIGNPILPETGEKSAISLEIESLKERIESELNLPVHLQLEWFSSVESEKILKKLGAKNLKRKCLVDKLSAAIILQSYLEKYDKA